MCKEEKKALRAFWLKRRDDLSFPAREEKSAQIARRVLALVEEKQIQRVFCYVSANSEVMTHALIEKLLQKGKTVAVPFCDTVHHTMDAVVIDSLSQLTKGALGILAPKEKGAILCPKETDLVLVPALAFDKAGFRLGYGGGYYDRYLKAYTGLTVGLAFSESMAEALPHEPWDVPVNFVICE